MLTVDEIRTVLPEHLKGAANQDLADKLNTIAAEPETVEAIRETFLGYTRVLNEGRFRIEDYVNAAAYVSYKLMGYNNQEAYSRTFPQKYQALVAKGASNKEISSYVAIYNKGKLVNLIMGQALIPIHIMNQDVFQKAVMEQAFLMANAKSEMVRMQAANSILTHLKPPEKKEIGLTISTPENSGLDALKDLLTAVAERQRELIEKGATTREIAHQKIMIGGAKDSGNIPEMIDVTPAEES